MRVTLTVPRAAAARLRALAAAGAPQLRALGILSVQLDGDAAVSLRLQQGAEIRIDTQPQGETLPSPSVSTKDGCRKMAAATWPPRDGNKRAELRGHKYGPTQPESEGTNVTRSKPIQVRKAALKHNNPLLASETPKSRSLIV